MRNPNSFHYLLGLALVLGTSCGLQAQSTPTASSTYAVRIAGLTSEERDAVVRELAITDQTRIVFACVPAGVLVFGPAPTKSREVARAHASAAIATHVQAQRVTEAPISLADAEAACAEARNR